MSQNKYIVSNLGFLKEIQLSEKRDKERDLFDIIWTSKLRDAQKFTKNQANLVIKKHNLNCFVWNPYEEEHTKEKDYKVVRRSSFYNILDDSSYNVLEWLVVKNFSHKTDIGFLTKGSEELYDFVTATRIAREKNELILQEITNVLNK
jgi:hypothetical protein